MVSNLSFESFKIKNLPNSNTVLINSPLPWFNEKRNNIDKSDVDEAIIETIRNEQSEKSHPDGTSKHKISSIPNINNLLYVLCFILIIFYLLNYL